MKKKFTLEVMFGDADAEDTFTCISDFKEEIDFLTYFLENFNYELSRFFDRPDLLEDEKDYEKKKERLISVINKMATLCNGMFPDDDPNKLVMLSNDADTESMCDVLSEIFEVLGDFQDWHFYHMDYFAHPISYNIEDISEATVLTRVEALAILKEKLGPDIILVD